MINTQIDLASQGKRHLIFDFDNTLFYLHLPWAKWHEMMTAAAKKRGVDLSTKTPLWSTNVNNAVKTRPELINDFREVQTNFEAENLNGIDVNQPLLDWITSHREFTFSIWSAQSMQTIQTILEKYQFTNVFENIMCRDTLQFMKPDSQGFELINEGHLPKNEFLMIGDSHNDEEAAMAAGIDFLHLSMNKV